jgi:PhoPQ-activated pathogenicity-related protein
VPNTDHSLKNSDAPETLLACYQAVLANSPLPKFSWTVEKNGSIRVKTETPVKEVKLWQATNPDGRNFTLYTLGPAWKSSPLTAKESGEYVAAVEKPAKGWTAYFAELTYPGPGSVPLKFTTEVRVNPDVLPHTYKEPNRKMKGFMSGR